MSWYLAIRDSEFTTDTPKGHVCIDPEPQTQLLTCQQAGCVGQFRAVARPLAWLAPRQPCPRLRQRGGRGDQTAPRPWQMDHEAGHGWPEVSVEVLDMLEYAEDAEREDQVVIAEGLTIPLSELEVRFSRSSGPGGQHVNRSETRVELLFDILRSPSLTEDQRLRLMERLGSHVDAEGVLRVVSSETRSQFENRALAIARFKALLASALRRRKRRIPTRPTEASRAQRLTTKRQRAGVKRMRRRVGDSDDLP